MIAPLGSWSLKTKFALCSGLLMFVFSVAFTTWTLHAVRADVRDSVTDAQRALVRTTAGDIDEKIELRRDALITIARLLADQAAASDARHDAFFDARPVLQKMFDNVVVVDAGGRVVYDLPHGSAATSTGASVAASDWFRRILDGSPLEIGGPLQAAGGGGPCVVFAAPLHGSDGRVNGALIGSLDLLHANFLGNLGRVRIGREGYFAVIKPGTPGVFVMHGQRDRILTPTPGGGAIMERARQGLEGSVEGINTQGVETLRTFIPLRTVPWMLMAVYPTSEAYAGVHAREREVVWLGCVLFVLAWVAAWLMSGWLLRPLHRLRRELDHPASAAATPHLPPGGFGSAELAALARAYNAQVARQQEFEGRLQASERRMRGITDNLPVLIAHVDRDERYLFLNATFQTWKAVDPVASLGRSMAEVMTPALYAQRLDKIRRCLAGERVSFEEESRAPGGHKTLHTSYIPERDADGTVGGFYILVSDVSELKDAQRQLARLVRSDSLTGLPNRYQFDETLPLALARSRRSGLALALMFLDIDHFKHINDSFGHGVGDAVLQEFSLRLKHAVRGTDMAARLGGDEFVVILEGLHSDGEPQAVARKVLAEIERPFELEGRTLAVTTSMGMVYQAAGDASATHVLALADAALYKAKAAGRNTFRMAAA